MVLKKSQVSMEFFILVGAALLMVIVFSFASLDHLEDFEDQREYNLVKDIALKLQTEIYLAATSEEGYRRQFDIPDKLEDVFNYSVVIKNNNSLIVYTTKSLYIVSVPQIEGSISKGINNISKQGGIVYVN